MAQSFARTQHHASRRSQHCRSFRVAARRSHAGPCGVCPRARDPILRAGISCRDLHRAVGHHHWRNSRRTWHRGQWLVRSRIGRAAVLETKQPHRARRKNLGPPPPRSPGFYLRETFLVVQHARGSGFLHHAKAALSGRRTQGLRHPHAADAAARRTQTRPRRVSVSLILGAGRGHRLIRMDRLIREVDRRKTFANAELGLSAASGLFAAKARPACAGDPCRIETNRPRRERPDRVLSISRRARDRAFRIRHFTGKPTGASESIVSAKRLALAQK